VTVSTPHTDIPEKTVTAGSEAVYGHRLNYDDRDVDGRIACLCGQWREPDDMAGDEYSWGHHVARAVLAAALPALNTARDAETAEQIDAIAGQLSGVVGAMAAGMDPLKPVAHGVLVSLRSLAASLRGEQP
jgi:hypothetical protein